MPIKNVLLVGASGKIGAAILDALLKHPDGFHVTILLRVGSKLRPADGVPVLHSDFSRESFMDSCKGRDAVVCNLVEHAILKQMDIIDAAVAAGVQHFVPSEFGHQPEAMLQSQGLPLFRDKAQVRQHLVHQGAAIDWTVIHTGFFLEWALETAFLGFDVNKHEATLYKPYEGTRFSVSSESLIGQSIARSLSTAHAACSKNRIFHMRSTTVSQLELLTRLEAASKTEWAIKHEDFDAQYIEAEGRLREGDLTRRGTVLKRVAFNTTADGDFDARGLVTNHMLDLPEESLVHLVDAFLGNRQATTDQ